ncbi:MAG: class I SAM-dependent methyltransferase [Candidatus Dormibacteraeota bacterium]|nr:class I SAM-dependent methyltransferase [Candidatus Dormibacteraeota bacterium]
MSETGWSESDSAAFLTYGDLFVPDRETQFDAVCSLIDPRVGTGDVIELCCGDGSLAQAVLERHPTCRVFGLDGSTAMLQRARVRLASAGTRFRTAAFDLADTSWRSGFRGCAAVVSSLAVHHLTSPQKRALFRDLAAMLAPGGAFILADLMQPASRCALAFAARQWDDAVRRRSLQRYGDDRGREAFQRLRWNAFRYPDTEVDHLATLAEHLTWLDAAGFDPIDVVWAHAGHVVVSAVRVSPRFHAKAVPRGAP